MPVPTSPDSELLNGKRLLMIGRDHELLSTLAVLLSRAGCSVSGSVGQFTDGRLGHSNSSVDIAVIDIDGGNFTDMMLVEHLKDRGIPLLLMYSPARGSPPKGLGGEHQLHKPFEHAHFFDALVRTLAVAG